jgi:HSP20 family protein
MRTIIRTSRQTPFELREDVVQAVTWQVRSGTWNPPTDVYETDDEYVVRIEVAGMRDEDFEVVLENNALFVAGFRQDLPGRRAYHQMEIRFGKFVNTVILPGAVEADAAHAEYSGGFLTVHLPRSRIQNEGTE